MPGSAKSPYRELDVDAKARPALRRPKAKDGGVWSGANDPAAARYHHDWEPTSRRTSTGYAPRLCRWCKQPRFVVEGKPCPGKKNNA